LAQASWLQTSQCAAMPFKIAVLAGDGIGPEVMQEGKKVLDAVAKKFGHAFEYEDMLVGGAAYEAHGMHLPAETLEKSAASDAILFGSVGGPVNAQTEPKWKDCEKNSLLGLRKTLQLAVNVRPARVYPFLQHLCPLKPSLVVDGIDLVIIRELVAGIYMGGVHKTEGDTARDECLYTVEQILKPMRYAFECARGRRKKLTVVDKANVLETSRLWRRVAKEVAPDFPDVELDYMYVDNAAMQLIQKPSFFDVIVTENMFGDILSDAASVLPGSIGLMPSASLGEKVHMYEPGGGSAPDIAGKGLANPIAQILSAAMMLRISFQLEAEAKAIEAAVETVLQSGVMTGDLVEKGAPSSSTAEVGDAIVAALMK